MPTPPQNLTPDWDRHVVRYSAKYNVDPNLVRAMIQQESQGNPNAVSQKGAIGLMQIMPSLAALYKRDPHNPEANIHIGTAHLADMLKLFGGDTTKAVAAYNAGEVPVRRANGIPNIPETQDYVRRVLGHYQRLSSPLPSPIDQASTPAPFNPPPDAILNAMGRLGTR